MNGKTRLTIEPVAEIVQSVDIRKQVELGGGNARKGGSNSKPSDRQKILISQHFFNQVYLPG